MQVSFSLSGMLSLSLSLLGAASATAEKTWRDEANDVKSDRDASPCQSASRTLGR
jgi:hypothetical protein